MAISKATLKEQNKGKSLNQLLETPEGISALIVNFHTIQGASVGAKTDYKAVDVLIDFSIALENAKLTKKQRLVVQGTIEGINQRELARAMGVSQQAVSEFLKSAVRKIAHTASKQKPRGKLVS